MRRPRAPTTGSGSAALELLTWLVSLASAERGANFRPAAGRLAATPTSQPPAETAANICSPEMDILSRFRVGSRAPQVSRSGAQIRRLQFVSPAPLLGRQWQRRDNRRAGCEDYHYLIKRAASQWRRWASRANELSALAPLRRLMSACTTRAAGSPRRAARTWPGAFSDRGDLSSLAGCRLTPTA